MNFQKTLLGIPFETEGDVVRFVLTLSSVCLFTSFALDFADHMSLFGDWAPTVRRWKAFGVVCVLVGPIAGTVFNTNVAIVRGARALRVEKARAEEALAELRRAQRQLVESEKMASLGSLVAGVAHEINTPVGTALTASTLLSDRTAQFKSTIAAGQLKRADLAGYLDSAVETAELILSNIRRAAELIQSFKQVAVDQTSAERRAFDLAEYLDEVITSLTPRLRKSAVQLTVNCPPGLTLDSYPGVVAQVITNLVMNSLMHAYDEEQAGHIELTVEARSGRRVEIRFADDGKGIRPEHLEKIFEPFFTTRRGSGGTGLGLHIVYNIVTQQLGGAIEVASIVGKGTVFTLRLPLELAGEDGRRGAQLRSSS